MILTRHTGSPQNVEAGISPLLQVGDDTINNMRLRRYQVQGVGIGITLALVLYLLNV